MVKVCKGVNAQAWVKGYSCGDANVLLSASVIVMVMFKGWGLGMG